MGEVIALAQVARVRRQRAARALHAACRGIIATSVVAARSALVAAPADEWRVRAARVRKLEELEAWAAER